MNIVNKTNVELLTILVEKVFEDIKLHVNGNPIDNLVIDKVGPDPAVVHVTHESCEFVVHFYDVRKTKKNTNYHWRLFGSFTEFPMGGGVIKIPR